AGEAERQADPTLDSVELVEFYDRLGDIYETRLSDTQSAIRSYRRIFDDLEKAHTAAIAALARIYERLEAWSELNVVYERELENAAGDAAEAEIRAKLANLAALKLA